MPSKPRTPCPVPGCPELTRGGRCEAHARQSEALRGSASARGYDTRWKRIRKAYLYKNPWCLLCAAQATVADHYPLSRKALRAQGVDPDTPSRLRPLCALCHNKETAQHQPGGWAAQQRASAPEW